jgi:hypothetical protein
MQGMGFEPLGFFSKVVNDSHKKCGSKDMFLGEEP